MRDRRDQPVVAEVDLDRLLSRVGVGHVSPEALDRTRETGEAHYYSRSRDELWHKGGSSG
ncbi:hypothetical protein DJ71_01885, partial [Halorubrum sp. E3]